MPSTRSRKSSPDRREDDDVVTDRDRVRLRDEPGMRRIERSASTLSSSTASTRPRRRSLYGCTSSSYETAVDAVLALRGVQQDLVRHRTAERRDATAAQIRERAEALAVGGAHREHLAKLVVRHARGDHRAARRRVLDAVEPDVEVAAHGGLVERCERDLDELRRATELLSDQLRDLDVEADELRRILGVRLHERRPALGVAAPAKDRILSSGRACAREKNQKENEGRHSHFGAEE